MRNVTLATTSHPIFEKSWNDQAKSYDREVTSRVRKFLLTASSDLMQLENADGESSSCRAWDFDDYFGFSQSSYRSKRATSSTVDLPILRYPTDSDCFLTCLLRHSLVKAMFLKLNTDLPTSAAVERLFSLAGVTLALRKNRLSDTMFQRVVLLKSNADIHLFIYFFNSLFEI